MFLIVAAAFFAAFTLNVAMGSTGSGAFLDDVGEMLCLFAAAIAFVVAVLRREAARRAAEDRDKLD